MDLCVLRKIIHTDYTQAKYNNLIFIVSRGKIFKHISFFKKTRLELLLLKLRNSSQKKKKNSKKIKLLHDFLCNKSKGNCDVRGSFLSSKVKVRVIILITCMSQVPRLINFAYFKSLNS